MDNIMSKIRSLDAYPKINEDFYSRTLPGGVITLASSIVMLLLFISELSLSSLSLSLIYKTTFFFLLCMLLFYAYFRQDVFQDFLISVHGCFRKLYHFLVCVFLTQLIWIYRCIGQLLELIHEKPRLSQWFTQNFTRVKSRVQTVQSWFYVKHSNGQLLKFKFKQKMLHNAQLLRWANW